MGGWDGNSVAPRHRVGSETEQVERGQNGVDAEGQGNERHCSAPRTFSMVRLVAPKR